MGPDFNKQNPNSQEFNHSGQGEEHLLILHNDDVNTFDHVIDSLVVVCGHDPIQAEQCAFITHHRGRCDVRRGDAEVLQPMLQGLIDRGLLVTID